MTPDRPHRGRLQPNLRRSTGLTVDDNLRALTESE
jgi:hypothetical protein